MSKVVIKVCPICGKEFEVNGNKAGWNLIKFCSECKESGKVKEHTKQLGKEYYESHKEHIKERRKTRNYEEYDRRYKDKNRERINAKRREYYKRNKSKELERARKYSHAYKKLVKDKTGVSVSTAWANRTGEALLKEYDISKTLAHRLAYTGASVLLINNVYPVRVLESLSSEVLTILAQKYRYENGENYAL